MTDTTSKPSQPPERSGSPARHQANAGSQQPPPTASAGDSWAQADENARTGERDVRPEAGPEPEATSRANPVRSGAQAVDIAVGDFDEVTPSKPRAAAVLLADSTSPGTVKAKDPMRRVTEADDPFTTLMGVAPPANPEPGSLAGLVGSKSSRPPPPPSQRSMRLPAAAPLPRSVPRTAATSPAAEARRSTLPPTLPRSARPSPPSTRPPNPGRSSSVPPVPEFASVTPPRRGASPMVVALSIVGAALIVAIAIVARGLFTGGGGLVVAVAGPGNQPIAGVSIFVDGNLVCEAAPCRVNELEAGPHLVRASAPGFIATADQAVSIQSGQDTAFNLSLAPAESAAGLRVECETPGAVLFVDGARLGSLPRDLDDVAPGAHSVRIEAGERFEAFEQQVVTKRGEVQVLGPIHLPVLRGKLSLTAGEHADKARVKVGGKSVKLPSELLLDAKRSYDVVALRPGFRRFTQEVRFTRTQPDVALTIDLELLASTGQPNLATRSSAWRAALASDSAGTAENAKDNAAPALDMGKLDLDSKPESKVVLDGRPLGSTPQFGIAVPAGAHNVTFIHTELGRQNRQVTIEPGKRQTVAVAFE